MSYPAPINEDAHQPTEPADGNADADAAAAIQDEARKLRLELEDQLLRVRSLSFEEQVEYSVDEQLSELMILVSQYSDEAVERALVLTIGTPNQDGYTGRYPLHLACDTNAPVDIIRFFLQHEPTRLAVRHRDRWEDLPLHTACSRKDYLPVVRLLLEYDDSKETIYTPRYDGSLPIHTACRYNAPPQVIEMLLENDTTRKHKTLFVESLYGQVPLHVACRCNLNPHSMRVLLHYDVDKKTVMLRDNADRIPLHVAYLHCPPPTPDRIDGDEESSIQILLEAMLHGRIERVGLLNWKHDMHTFLVRLGIPERDFNASDRLEMTCQAFEMLLERAILLELAIWKASCCCSTHCNVGLASMEMSMKNLPQEFKREQRIMSGAEMIIPGVLSFLEDEPIRLLLEQMGF